MHNIQCLDDFMEINIPSDQLCRFTHLLSIYLEKGIKYRKYYDIHGTQALLKKRG